jgi:alpha-L-rhamnosidase
MSTMTDAPLTPYDLQTEHRSEPLGIDARAPRFSWRLRSERRGAAQSAYRITVRDGSAEAWDSGWVEDGATTGVEYGGPLRSRTRYAWTLEVRDETGTTGRVSESWFETALLDASEFTGSWIGREPRWDSADNEFDPPVDDDIPAKARHIPPASYLRRGFALESPVTRARIYATARGIYQLHLNGSRVGTDELAPGWTDYNDRILYQTYDVTDLVQGGENVLGMVLADGWWSGYVGFDSRRQGNHYGTAPAGWAMAVLEHEDGTETVVATDDSWRESRGAIHYTDLLMGEYIDARRDLGPWSEPGYDDGRWAPVQVLGEDFAVLAAQPDEPIRVTEVVPAVDRIIDPEGRILYDFGQNLVGRVRIELGAMGADEQVVLRHGETLDEGRLYTANLRTAEARDVYVSAGSDANRFEPLFTLHGFRYLEVSGLSEDRAPGLSAVSAAVLHNDTPFVGALETSSDDVNKLLSNIRWGQRGNFVGVPTDCPQRDERLGWMADAQVFLPTAALNADVAAFFTRWLRDVRFSQSEEGSFPDVAPVVSNFFHDGAPAWGDAGVIMPWHLYRVYGDRRLLADSFDSMARWVDFLERENPSLLWTRRVGNHYGDWLQIDAVTPRPVLATAYFAHSASLVARAARVLGYTRRAEHYEDLARRIRKAFVEAYVGPDGRIEGDTQTDYLMAIAFDLLPQELAATAGEHLARTVEEHDGLLTTGFVGVSLLCPVLSDIGRSDLAFALLETDRYPSWLYSVRHGATTIWERWDGWTEHAGFQSVEMNSLNHYSLGSVGEWLYRYVAGIDQTPDSVAYETLRVAPQIGGSLTAVSASYETPRGRVATSWTLDEEDGLSVSLEVPPGATALVTLPSSAVEEGGVAVEELELFSDVQVTDGTTAFRAPSGRFSFRARVAVPAGRAG